MNDPATITDSAYLSSTLANAKESGLTLDDLIKISEQIYIYEEEYGKMIEDKGEFVDVLNLFDETVTSMATLKEIVRNGYFDSYEPTNKTHHVPKRNGRQQ